jgi:anti-sigma B factor antagonist
MAELDEGPTAELRIDMLVDPSGACVITLAGELDVSNVDSLNATVASATEKPAQQLIFDLAELRFMDSAGIAVLINATEKAESVRLRNASPIVKRLVEATGLTRVLPIEP